MEENQNKVVPVPLKRRIRGYIVFLFTTYLICSVWEVGAVGSFVGADYLKIGLLPVLITLGAVILNEVSWIILKKRDYVPLFSKKDKK